MPSEEGAGHHHKHTHTEEGAGHHHIHTQTEEGAGHHHKHTHTRQHDTTIDDPPRPWVDMDGQSSHKDA
jgi:hypothetical protein